MAPKTNRTVQYFAGISAAFTFVFTGATLAWSSPAIPKFKSGEANVEITDSQISWVVSLNGLGALLGCYFGQKMNERIGRRGTLLGSSVPSILGASIIMFTKMPEMMYVARFVIGIGTGIIAVVTIIYITEIADKEIRGALGMAVQIMNNFGALLLYGVGPFVSYTVVNSIVLTLPVCYVLLCVWIPESPYYHLKDGRVQAAKKAFMKLRGTDDEKWVDDQMAVIRAHVRESMENKTTLKELLTNKMYRKALYIVAGLKILQYMTGILVIQSYLEVIFRQSSSFSAAYSSILYGFVQILAGVVSTFLTRWVGKRILMFASCLGVSISMTILGAYFYIQDATNASPETLSSLSMMPLIGVLGFNIFYANGLGTLPYVMQAELFPVNVKAVASSLATMIACILSFVVPKCYQNVKDNLGHYTVFWTFAAVGYAGLFFIYFFVPETIGKTLEEVLDNVQNKPAEREALNKEEMGLNTLNKAEVSL